jgi:uncharacterized protein YbbC (DUF1343 family)
VVILDRPNPLGFKVSGPAEPYLQSYVSYSALKSWTNNLSPHYNIYYVNKRPSACYDQAFWKIHIGDPDIIKLVESGLPLTEEHIRVQISSWKKTIAKFKQQRKAWLLY